MKVSIAPVIRRHQLYLDFGALRREMLTHNFALRTGRRIRPSIIVRLLANIEDVFAS